MLRSHAGQIDFATLLASGGLATLFVAGLTGYVNLTRQVEERATPTEVRQIVDDKTLAKYDEILRRLDRIDRQLDRLTLLTPSPQGK